MPNFQQILQEIRDDTGWSDYKIAKWINTRGNKEVLVHQPLIFRLRTGQLEPGTTRLDQNYRLGRRILDLHKRRHKVKK